MNPGQWESTVLTAGTASDTMESVKATISRSSIPGTDQARQVTVRGTTGTYESDVFVCRCAMLSVDLDDGRTLTIEAYPNDDGRQLTEQELIRIADEMTIWPTPEYAWLGSR